MKKLLELKHWHLFVLIYVGPFLMTGVYMVNFFRLMSNIRENAYMSPDEVFSQMFSGMPWVFLGSFVFTLILYAWMWSIGHVLYPMRPAGVRMNLNVFKATIIIPIITTVIAMGLMVNFFDTMSDMAVYERAEPPAAFFNFILIFPLQLLTLFCSFYNFWFCARMIKTVETQRENSMGDYLIDIIFLWFNVVGIWFLQPRLNRIVNNQPPPLPYDPVDHLIA